MDFVDLSGLFLEALQQLGIFIPSTFVRIKKRTTEEIGRTIVEESIAATSSLGFGRGNT